MKIKPNDMVMFINPIEWQCPETGEKVTLIRCGTPATVARVDGKGFCMFEEPITVRAESAKYLIRGTIDHAHEDFLMTIRHGGNGDEVRDESSQEVSA